MTTVSRYILNQLTAFGVQRIYGVAGDTQLHLIAETAGHNIQFVPACHESSAAFMAAADAMLTGKPGVCLATSGPGVANMLNGLGEAYGDKLPMLAITGQTELKKIGSEAKQYLEQQSMLRPLACYSAEVVDAEAMGKVLPLALLKAHVRRQLTHLSVPKDILQQPSSAQVMSPPIGLMPHLSPSPIALKVAFEIMNKSRQPLILAGLGARRAMPEIIKLAEAWGAGIITSLGAKGAISREHQLYLHGLGQGGSEPASELLSQCDVLLLIGCNWWPSDYAVANVANVIQVDINPEAINCGAHPHVALIGDAQDVTWQLRAGLTTEADATWRQVIVDGKAKWEAHIEAEVVPSSCLHPAVVMRELERLGLTESIFTVDTGDHTVWFNRHFHGLCQRVLFSGKWRTLGFALPAAITAGLVEPQRRIICIIGDGGLNMVMSELATLVRENLLVTVVVIKNHTYAIEKNRMENAGLTTVGVDLPAIDYVKVAEACGLAAQAANDLLSLQKSLQQALAHQGPYLISVEVGNPHLPHVKL